MSVVDGSAILSSYISLDYNEPISPFFVVVNDLDNGWNTK